jgi:MGT family glycosyltransferase
LHRLCRGHWDPLKVLARELVERGCRITFIHMPDAVAMLEDTPFGFAAVGGGTHGPGALAAYRRRLARAPSLGGFLPMLRATADMSAMLLQDLPAVLARIGADAVVADETEPAGALVARRLGLPYVTSITGLPLLRDPLVPPPFVGWEYRRDAYGLRRNAGGYRVAARLMRPIRKVLERHARVWRLDLEEIDRGSSLLQVAQCPPELDFPRAGLPASFRYCGPFRAPTLPELELPRDRPLVYCSLGSLQGNRPRLFADMAAACVDVGARAIVAHGGLLGRNAVRRLPGDPLTASFWPQPATLPQCRAAILHGGFNTVLDALAAGVPMAVAPLAFEQAGTGARVARSGAGVVLSGRPLTRRKLRSALHQILEEGRYRSAAETMAVRISHLGGARLAADLVMEALTSGRIPPAAPA